MILTWDNNGDRSRARRAIACGERYCTDGQEVLAISAGLNPGKLKLSCDEFPFASTEEGGNYLSTLRVNPTNPQRTCVPAWQNTLQGTCNSEHLSLPMFCSATWLITSLVELLNEIYTNVGYFNRSARGDQAVNWAKWGGNGGTNWLTGGSLGDGGGQPQRQALYPDQQPKPAGISDAVSVIFLSIVNLA